MGRLLRIFRWLSTGGDELFQDGLDTTASVERLERELHIRIRDQDASRLRTLGDLCRFVSDQRREQSRPLSDERIWEVVRQITSEELGIDVKELNPGTRYVEDLSC